MSNDTIKDQASTILTQVAGYVAVRTMATGLEAGFFRNLETSELSATRLAELAGSDPLYTRVWCRSAYAAGLLEAEGADADEGYDSVRRDFDSASEPVFRLAPHVATLLLDESHPGYLGGMPNVLTQPEIFESFSERLSSGKRLWWNECSHRFIGAVSGTGVPFYSRMIPSGLERIPGLLSRLHAGADVTELCCGSGRGLQRFAETFPKCTMTGVDGDGYSLKVARQNLDEAGLSSVRLVESSLEELDLADQDMIFINISMHECRDIERVARNVKQALRPGGLFVISDFPFPSSTAACRSVPGQILSGIQVFEALIGDQLMSTKAFVELLERHDFSDVSHFDITPVHAVTYGTR